MAAQALFASLATTSIESFVLAVGLALLLAVGGTAWGLRQLRHARLMQDLPTSRIASAAQGYVELEGHAGLLPGPPIYSPLTRARCVWWDYQVERRDRRMVNGRSRSEWKTIARATSDELFLLTDPSGDCVVDPHGAKVHPSLRRRWQGHGRVPAQIPERSPWISFGGYRYTERLVKVGDPLYTVGLFRTQHGQHSFSEGDDVRELLADWKRDRRQLLQRFDTNGDGEIDLGEWEAAREAALQAVRQRHVEQAVMPDLHVLCQPTDRRPFLLSTMSEADLGRRTRIGGALWLLAGLAGFVFAAMALEARGLL